MSDQPDESAGTTTNEPKSRGLNENHSQTYTNDPDRERTAGEKMPGD